MNVQHWPWHLKWVAPLALLGALAILYLCPPTEFRFYPQCLFQSLTGLSCPGCGSLRSVHHLLHGDFAAAFHFNPLLYLLAPALVVWRKRLHQPAWLWSLLAVIAAFTVARNL